MPKTYQREMQIPFHHADPAGIAFFAHVFTYAHSTFEAFIQDLGIPWNQWFKDNEQLVPIRHASSDFFGPFWSGQVYVVKAHVASLSDTSFKMRYRFLSGDKLHAQVEMVHTFVDKKTLQKTPMPQSTKKLLNGFLHEES